MLKIEKTVLPSPEQWEIVIEGMRNPMNSWEKSDSTYTDEFVMGSADLNLMKRLAKGGPVHAKYRRMIPVLVTLTAPLYWWKECDAYKVGTVANSCSTMHKIHAKEFARDDFSCEHLSEKALGNLDGTIEMLNDVREDFLATKDKKYWWQMIQLLPSSYNQKRTLMLNYEVLVNMYHSRKNHKLDEWHTFCDWIEMLPNAELITGRSEENG